MNKLLLEKLIRKIIKENIEEDNVLPLKDIFYHYIEYGDLEGIFIPDFGNERLNWFFNGMLSIINEIKQNNISTSDYFNMDNLGVKSNGNLAMFDIGFGNYFDEFEDLPEELNLEADNNLHNNILINLGFKKSKNIGSGMFGNAFDVGGNKILKITKDKTEAVNCNKIKGKTLNHIANVFEVKRITLNQTEYYLIVLEKLNTKIDFQNLYNKLENHINGLINKHLDKNIINQIYNKHKVVGSFLKDMVKIGYDKTWIKWKDYLRDNGFYDKYDFNDISEISYWIKGSVTNNNDIDDSPPDYVMDLVNELIK